MKSEENKIINILKIEKVGKLYQVFPSSGEPIKVTEEQIVKFRILKGTSYTLDEWKQIEDSLNESMVLAEAMHYIDYKLRTVKEVKEYLIKKAYSEDVINSVINKLKEIHYLDDDRYAKLYCEEKIRNKMGSKVIEYNLMSKGIPSNITYEYLKVYPLELLEENAYEVACATLKTVSGYPVNKQKESIYQRLVRMGYDQSIISKVMNRLVYSSVDLNKLEKEYLKLVKKETEKPKIIQKLMAKGYTYQDIKELLERVQNIEEE